MIEKVEEADINYVHQGKVSYTARETIRNIVFMPGALPSKGLHNSVYSWHDIKIFHHLISDDANV